MDLLGVSNVVASAVPLVATASIRGTEIARTAIAAPYVLPPVNETSALGGKAMGSPPMGSVDVLEDVELIAQETGMLASHVWTARQRKACVITLPEDCWERLAVDVEVDLWQAGAADGETGGHLGQVRLASHVTLSAKFSRAPFARRASVPGAVAMRCSMSPRNAGRMPRDLVSDHDIALVISTVMGGTPTRLRSIGAWPSSRMRPKQTVLSLRGYLCFGPLFHLLGVEAVPRRGSSRSESSEVPPPHP